jgi:hypothetical protein
MFKPQKNGFMEGRNPMGFPGCCQGGLSAFLTYAIRQGGEMDSFKSQLFDLYGESMRWRIYCLDPLSRGEGQVPNFRVGFLSPQTKNEEMTCR